jgi:hypothetical protein
VPRHDAVKDLRRLVEIRREGRNALFGARHVVVEFLVVGGRFLSGLLHVGRIALGDDPPRQPAEIVDALVGAKAEFHTLDVLLQHCGVGVLDVLHLHGRVPHSRSDDDAEQNEAGENLVEHLHI